jgi:cytochrome c-type biogenesis protein CcmH/NrfG
LEKAAFDRGNFKDAKRFFEKLVFDFPKTVEGYTALSSVAFALGEYQTACDALITATKLKPDDPELLNQLGKAYSNLGKHELAEETFRKALLLDAGNLNAHVNLANTAFSQNNYQEAGRHYLDALNYHPDNVDLWITSGQFALSMNDAETARAAFRRALSLDPSREDAQKALEEL